MPDYLDSLPGGHTYRLTAEMHAAIENLTTSQAIESTMLRHRDALDQLSKL